MMLYELKRLKAFFFVFVFVLKTILFYLFFKLFIENSQYLQLTIFKTSNYTNKQQQQQKLTKNLQIDTKILTSQCFHY